MSFIKFNLLYHEPFLYSASLILSSPEISSTLPRTTLFFYRLEDGMFCPTYFRISIFHFVKKKFIFERKPRSKMGSLTKVIYIFDDILKFNTCE
jgi:hypothetical protein